MFEKEIKFIADFSLNKVKKLGSFFTFEKLLTTDLHPAIIQFISAELDYLIHEDRNKLLQKSAFDYSGPEILKYFNLISQEIKKNKRISFEDFRKLVIQAVSFNVNFLVRPKWSLAKIIYNDKETQSVQELKLLMHYIYYYDYIKNVFSAYMSKRKIINLSLTEFELIMNKIDRELFKTQPETLIDNALYSIADFFNEGGVNKSKISINAIELFLKEKNLMDKLIKLRKVIPSEDKQKYDVEEIRSIIYSTSVSPDQMDIEFEGKKEKESKKVEEEQREDEKIEMIEDDDKVDAAREEESPEEENSDNAEDENSEIAIEDNKDVIEEEDNEYKIDLEDTPIIDLDQADNIDINEESEFEIEIEDQQETEQEEKVSIDEEKKLSDDNAGKNDRIDKNEIEEPENVFKLNEEKISEDIPEVENDEIKKKFEPKLNDDFLDEYLNNEEIEINESEHEIDNSDDYTFENNIEEKSGLVDQKEEEEIKEEELMPDIKSSDKNTVPQKEFEKDIFSYLEDKEMEKIISTVFNDDREDFANTMEKISECKSYDEAVEILKGVFFSYRVSPYARDAVALTNVVSSYFNQAK